MGEEELQGYNDGIKQNLSDCQKKRIQRGFDNGWEMNREIKETSAESCLNFIMEERNI